MEITLKGKIKSLVKDFGFIFCEINKTDYFFHQSSLIKKNEALEVGQIVSFKLRANRGREGSHAVDVQILERIGKSDKRTNSTGKNKYFFESKSDMIVGLRHIKEKLNIQRDKCDKKYIESELVKDQINDILDIIEDFFEGPMPNINNISFIDLNNSENSSDLNRNNLYYWSKSFSLQEFGQQVQSVSLIEVDKGGYQDFSIVWHEWKDQEKQIFNAGYTKGHFNYSFIEKGSKEQTSVYDSPPPAAKWKVKKIVQKGYEFYISSAPVCEIAQSSSVPALPPKLGIVETAERILDKNRISTEWQREIVPGRIRKIAEFISESTNIIANAPMLFIQDEEAVQIINDELIINFAAFLKKQEKGEFKGFYIDRKLKDEKDEFGNDVYDDYRPFWIIDGQHRVRGIHWNEDSQNLEIPIIIFPKGFEMSNTAKVFAEINTLQRKLNPLHELFMQHRFSIDHTNPKRKFKNFRALSLEDALTKGWSLNDWLDSRANHFAYEILALLAKKGPLRDRVQFLPQNEDKNTIYVSADQWVNYARTLFRKCYKYINGEVEDYVFKPTAREQRIEFLDLFYEEMNNYFTAWVCTCNHKDWPDNKTRWTDKTKGKALIQKKTHFIILIELYNLVRVQALEYKRSNNLGGLVKVEEFIEILKPFKWVDWSNDEIEKTYGGGGEKGRRSLEAWMADAIINGVQYSYEEIFNEKIKSQPGRGITSLLDVAELQIISSNKWPTKDAPVIFKSIRPWNARYESSWRVEDVNEDLKDSAKMRVGSQLGPLAAEYYLNYEKYMDDPSIKELRIRVDWKNSHTHTGKKTITIYK